MRILTSYRFLKMRNLMTLPKGIVLGDKSREWNDTLLIS